MLDPVEGVQPVMVHCPLQWRAASAPRRARGASKEGKSTSAWERAENEGRGVLLEGGGSRRYVDVTWRSERGGGCVRSREEE